MAAVAGVCPVLETPFGSDGELDVGSFVRLIEHVYAVGVRQVMYPGYASEFLKLSDEERTRMIDVLLAVANRLKDLEVIVSVPDHGTVVAVRSAQHAVSRGAHAISILPPYQLGPSAESVRDHVVSVAQAVSPTPVVAQYAPAQTGTSLSAPALASIAREAPNLSAVKVESVPPGSLVKALTAQTPSLPSAVGYGGLQLIDALRRGAVSVQPGSSFVELYLDIWKAWEVGAQQEAIDLHRRLVPYLSYWMQSVEIIVSAEKRISMLRGLITTDVCRAPNRTLDDQELADIDRFMTEFAGRLSVPIAGEAR